MLWRVGQAVSEQEILNPLPLLRAGHTPDASYTRDLENRPALQDMLVALHSNGTKVVLVERLDRLARDLMIQESIIADMKRHGFEIVSVAEPDLCSDDPEPGIEGLAVKLRGSRSSRCALGGVISCRYSDRK